MLINVNLPSKKYDVVLERGLLAHIKDFYDFGNSKVLVITDNGVPSFYSEILLKQLSNGHLLVLKQAKSRRSISLTVCVFYLFCLQYYCIILFFHCQHKRGILD